MGIKKQLQEDEIDLKELIITIWNKKFFIISFTLVITICSIVYVYFKYNKPIYQGSLLVEIGEIQSENFGNLLLDNPNNLLAILEKQKNIKVSIPIRTNNLLLLSSFSSDKKEIKKNLENTFSFILHRHEEKVKNYKNFIMTKKISDINIDNNPINKAKKNFIILIAFFMGFILSIFLVFFTQFINNIMKEEK